MNLSYLFTLKSTRQITNKVIILIIFTQEFVIFKTSKRIFPQHVLLFNPIYSLSFYKAPSKILNKIRAIQSIFLWNGSDFKRLFIGFVGIPFAKRVTKEA